MNNKSLDFQKINQDSTLPGIVRKSFRVPVENTGNIWVKINEKQYPVFDICCDGVSITIESSVEFTVDQSIGNCELTIFKSSFKNLKGRIIHLTAIKGNIWQYGIHWLDVEEKIAAEISKIITKMKEELLKDDNLSIDPE